MVTTLLLRCRDGEPEALRDLLDLFYPYAAVQAATRVPPEAVETAVVSGFVQVWEQAGSFRIGEDRAVAWVTARLVAGMEAVADSR